MILPSYYLHPWRRVMGGPAQGNYLKGLHMQKGNPDWVKGVSQNPGGKPKNGTRRGKWLRDLESAIKAVEYEMGIGLLTQAVRMAYKDPKMMAAILKKVLPDKRHVEADLRSVHDDWVKRLEDDENRRVVSSQTGDEYAVLR